MTHSPYLQEPNRLADVLSAFQVIGTSMFYNLDFAGWAARISGDAENEDESPMTTGGDE